MNLGAVRAYAPLKFGKPTNSIHGFMELLCSARKVSKRWLTSVGTKLITAAAPLRIADVKPDVWGSDVWAVLSSAGTALLLPGVRMGTPGSTDPASTCTGANSFEDITATPSVMGTSPTTLASKIAFSASAFILKCEKKVSQSVSTKK